MSKIYGKTKYFCILRALEFGWLLSTENYYKMQTSPPSHHYRGASASTEQSENDNSVNLWYIRMFQTKEKYTNNTIMY